VNRVRPRRPLPRARGPRPVRPGAPGLPAPPGGEISP
jgi:hypothetical protein